MKLIVVGLLAFLSLSQLCASLDDDYIEPAGYAEILVARSSFTRMFRPPIYACMQYGSSMQSETKYGHINFHNYVIFQYFYFIVLFSMQNWRIFFGGGGGIFVLPILY